MQQVPLRDFHASHGARLIDFAGWEMPVQYHSIIEEHKNTRQAASLFDVSHMGEILVKGKDARAFLDYLLTNDISSLFPGRILYSPMCQEDGGVIDDLLVYMRGENDYLLCVNASNTDKDFAWLQQHTSRFALSALENKSSHYGLLAIQGPASASIVQALTQTDLSSLKYYHFIETSVADIPCLLSRTGYTGEDGFELYHAAGDSQKLAETLLEQGAAKGLKLAGLGARDSLRLEAGFPLYGHELGAEISPLTAGLAWTVKLNKASDFIGRSALLEEKQKGPQKKVVYFKTGDRRIVRPDTPVILSNDPSTNAGRTLSGTFSPNLGEAIGSALIDSKMLDKALAVDIRGTLIPLALVKPPFIELKKS